MVNSQPQHADALQAFHTWRHSSEAQLLGIGGPDLEPTCPFIPRTNLENYFNQPHQLEGLLDAVLNSQQRPAVDANYVRDHYLQSFATLLCIEQGSWIYHFQQYHSLRDQKLPHRTRPDGFPITIPDIFEDFKDAQWQFCVPTLEYNMNDRYKAEDILPIITKEKIGEGGSAIVYKVVVDDNYNGLRPRDHGIPGRRHQHKNTFVLKTYLPAEAEANYNAESDAFRKLRWSGKPSAHIIAYYGGFIHGNSYNIMLEYADQGTLEIFMRKTEPPLSVEHTLLFWNRLFDVSHGIMTIHNVMSDDRSAARFFNGWHQDVKPANILVFSGDSDSPYDRHFKIADLGLTHFKPSDSPSNDTLDFDAFGTRAYGAPETFRYHRDTESAPLQVTRNVDIWSLGCIFSEASVWAHHGWKRVCEYRRQRSLEIEDKGGGKGEEMFHCDGERLDTVDTIHQDINITGQRRTSSHITRSVLERLVIDMLQPEIRLPAKHVFDKSKRLIKEFEKKFEISVDGPVGNTNGEVVSHAKPRTRKPPQLPPDADSTSSSSSSRSTSPPHKHYHKSTSPRNKRRSTGASGIPQSGGRDLPGVSNPLRPPSNTANTHANSLPQQAQSNQQALAPPTLSIAEGHEWKRKHKNKEYALLPGRENLTSLNERDHIFLIDNSATMSQYTREIARVISLLAYIVKGSDEDGLDIFYTQTTQKINSHKSSKLSSSISKQQFIGMSDMRGRLHALLQEHINKFGTLIQPPKPLFGRQPPPRAQRPLSFYILTDAKWQPTDVGGLIKDLVQDMIAKGRRKEHVGIQFIRFGNDPASIAKLDELDHGLGLGDIGMDIVDHTYWDGNVWKQLMGALNNWYDDDPCKTPS